MRVSTPALSVMSDGVRSVSIDVKWIHACSDAFCIMAHVMGTIIEKTSIIQDYMLACHVGRMSPTGVWENVEGTLRVFIVRCVRDK